MKLLVVDIMITEIYDGLDVKKLVEELRQKEEVVRLI